MQRTSSSPTDSVEMGEMDYGEDEALHFGAEYYPERRDCATEFHLITAWQKSAEDDQPVKRLAAEARFLWQSVSASCWMRDIR